MLLSLLRAWQRRDLCSVADVAAETHGLEGNAANGEHGNRITKHTL